MFTSVINNRLLSWSKNHNIGSDAQFGFKPGFGTRDAIFALHGLVNKTLRNGKRLYCCFIDYKKAFDSISHCNLWTKLLNLGIRGNLFNVIHSIYQNVKSCVKYNGTLSESFKLSIGLMQGEALSPILFSLYVNDLESAYTNSSCDSYTLEYLNLFLLMYADDTVLFSESATELQLMLDVLSNYSNVWKLTVNTSKTKVMVFRKSIRANLDTWFLDGIELERVNQFCYLGITLNYNGNFVQTQKVLASQARKAKALLWNKIKNNILNTETKLYLFDSYVLPVLNYGCEIWGFHAAPDIEKVHTDFIKQALGVCKRSPNAMLYFEVGRGSLVIKRKILIFKYYRPANA